MTARRGVGLTPMETRRDVIVRAAMLADELGYELFAVPEGWGLDSAPVLAEIALRTAPEVPVWVAALGHQTTRIAAELSDGWIPALVARDGLPAWTAQLNAVRATAAPQAKALTVVAGPIAAADENSAVARDIVATCIAGT